MKLLEFLPAEVKDSLWLLFAAIVTYVARRLRPKLESTEFVQKKAAIEEEEFETQKEVERVRRELATRFEEAEAALRQTHAQDAIRWQQRDDDLRQTVKDLVEQSLRSADMHAAALAQMQLYVNRLLDENLQLREESTEYKHAEELLRQQLEECQRLFEDREKTMEQERVKWENMLRQLQARLKDMTNRGIEKGVKLTGSDIFPGGE